MLRTTWLRPFAFILALLSLSQNLLMPVFAQTTDNTLAASEIVDNTTITDNASGIETDTLPFGEFNSTDLGAHSVFLPLINDGTTDEMSVAAMRWTVLEFGAIPNDNQDDTDAMQQAADFLCKNPGFTLIYPPGVYNVDRLVNLDTEFSGLISDKAITYQQCNNVKVLGPGAKIEVKGNFIKGVDRLVAIPPPPFCRSATSPEEFIPCSAVGEADRFQYIPFAFVNSQHFVLSGFEIDGNVDQMKQADATVYLEERSEYGIWIIDSHDFVLEKLFVHHMATDGISFTSSPGSDNGKINRVVSANNVRMALTIAGPVRNLEVVNSELRDSGVVGTAYDSYTPHSPARGVDIETECLPGDADWGTPSAGCRLTGNILFDRVQATGSLGGQIAFPHGSSSANITVRRSFLQNPIGKGGTVVNMGVAGGVVEDSILDAQLGYVDICFTDGDPAQLTSPIFARYLAELAADPSSVAQRIERETRSFSSTLRRNTIRGQNTLLFCENALPFVTIEDNKFQGAQPATVPEGSSYTLYGYLWVVGGSCDSPDVGRFWARDIQIRRNTFFIANSAPRHDIGVITYCGNVEHLQDNVYTTDVATAVDPITVRYDHVATVVNDCYPSSSSDGNPAILPIHGARLPEDPLDYPAFQPYPLAPSNCLNLP